jgi:hypothetical protein
VTGRKCRDSMFKAQADSPVPLRSQRRHHAHFLYRNPFSPPGRGYSTRLLLGDCDNVNLGGSSQFDRDRSFVFVAPPTDVRLAQGLSG